MTRANLLRMIGVLSGALAFALPVQAQDPQPAKLRDYVSMRPATPDEIVVSGHREATPAQVERQAKAISRVDGNIIREPLGRFRSRICPGIIGLSREMAELIVDRLRYNAERIGASLASADGCTANIILAFVRDGQSEVEGLLQSQPQAFSQLTRAERLHLLSDPGPVRTWANTVVRSRFGDEPRGETAPSYRDLVEFPVLSVGNSHSHVFLAHRLDIESAVVVIDVTAVDGLSINQIADYVTMRSFARTRPASADAAADTILTLFDPNAPPVAGLTEFDLAYLKSLYSSYDGARAVTTIAATSRALRRAAAAEVQAD